MSLKHICKIDKNDYDDDYLDFCGDFGADDTENEKSSVPYKPPSDISRIISVKDLPPNSLYGISPAWGSFSAGKIEGCVYVHGVKQDSYCNHSWTSYTGLNETFDYCSKCDKKREQNE